MIYSFYRRFLNPNIRLYAICYSISSEVFQCLFCHILVSYCSFRSAGSIHFSVFSFIVSLMRKFLIQSLYFIFSIPSILLKIFTVSPYKSRPNCQCPFQYLMSTVQCPLPFNNIDAAAALCTFNIVSVLVSSWCS
jgi:hypothetical protein